MEHKAVTTRGTERMHTFQELCIGDMFNTKPARWVKVSDTEAICVMGAVYPLGDIRWVAPDTEVVLLWSCEERKTGE